MSPIPRYGWIPVVLLIGACVSDRAEEPGGGGGRGPAAGADASTTEDPVVDRAPPAVAARFAADETLTLSRCLAEAEQASVGLQALEARRRANEVRRVQAGLRPNPELEVAVEGMPTEGRALDEAEYLVGVTQEIRLGDVRGRAQEVVQRQARALEQEAASVRRELRREVQGAFATALFAQRVQGLQERRREVGAELLGVLRDRQLLGDADGAEVTEGELRQWEVLDAVRGAERLAIEARRELALLLGAQEPDLPPLAGDLDLVLEVPALEDLVRRLSDHPEVLAAAARADVAQAAVALEEAERMPEVHLGLFYRRMQAERLDAFDLEFAVPLRFFDRGDQRVEAARWEAVEARWEEEGVRRETEARLRQAHARLAWALDLHQRLDQVFRPRAEALLQDRRTRYELGDLRRAEVWEAEEALLETQEALLEARREALEAWAELAPFLTG